MIEDNNYNHINQILNNDQKNLLQNLKKTNKKDQKNHIKNHVNKKIYIKPKITCGNCECDREKIYSGVISS